MLAPSSTRSHVSNNVRVRIAARVDVALRHGHQHDATSCQVVLMPVELTAVRPKRMFLIDNARVVDEERASPPLSSARVVKTPSPAIGEGLATTSAIRDTYDVPRTPSARRTGTGVTRGWP